jgi:hypothetical protein
LEGQQDVDECSQCLDGHAVLGVFEEVPLTALVFRVPIEDIELRVINVCGGVRRTIKTSKSSCVGSALRICVHDGSEERGERLSGWADDQHLKGIYPREDF